MGLRSWGWPRGRSKTIAGLKTSCRLGSPQICSGRRAMPRRRSTHEWCVTDDGCAARNVMWCRTAAPWRRATLVQYRRSSAPPGRQWTAPNSLVQPPPPDDQILPHVGSDDAGWTRSPAAHQNDSRKRFYNDGIKVLAEEKNSPFVRAVMIAEATSLVTNLGTHGIGYINGDLTAAFSRLPVDDWIGIQADSHWASDGISVGTATCSTIRAHSDRDWSPRSPILRRRSTSRAMQFR